MCTTQNTGGGYLPTLRACQRSMSVAVPCQQRTAAVPMPQHSQQSSFRDPISPASAAPCWPHSHHGRNQQRPGPRRTSAAPAAPRRPLATRPRERRRRCRGCGGLAPPRALCCCPPARPRRPASRVPRGARRAASFGEHAWRAPLPTPRHVHPRAARPTPAARPPAARATRGPMRARRPRLRLAAAAPARARSGAGAGAPGRRRRASATRRARCRRRRPRWRRGAA
jgi:hypothetical protein